ncbi:outer membrane lipoprotein carrier protein LolA [uncultured Lacinutrix sp.]|uniref:LolA family protein n=1 Tax=uncultured Lacinutrix sp. TaxID=574032 RepID=UPI00260452CA|nr:outer membrane lipoprotein carrier protein LolA [uncultured Lacinutrix sp.]
MRNLFFIFFLSVFAIQAQTKMDPVNAKALQSKVKALSKTSQTITSDFIQYKHLDFLNNDIKTSGKLSFKAPDLVKWEYVDPFSYAIVFKEEKLYINDNGNKSKIDIGSNKMFKQLNGLIIASVKGDMFDDNAFNITYYVDGKNSLVHFNPKEEKMAKYIKSFHITFNAKGDVVEVKMIEPSDDYTKIVFSNKVLNKTLPNEVFAH